MGAFKTKMFVLLATYGNFESQSQKKMDKKKKKPVKWKYPFQGDTLISVFKFKRPKEIYKIEYKPLKIIKKNRESTSFHSFKNISLERF